MTEFWVSQGNKWCDYCKIYIANNPTSLRTHEFGKRHKENVEKKLVEIRKKDAGKEKEKQLALKDLERIEKQAKKSYEKDLAAIRRSEAASGGVLERSNGEPGDGPPGTLKAASTSHKRETPNQPGDKTKIGTEAAPKAGNAPAAVMKSQAPLRGGKGVSSSLQVGKRKRVEKLGGISSEEANALAAREAARKRTIDREKALLGLYQ